MLSGGEIGIIRVAGALREERDNDFGLKHNIGIFFCINV